MSNKTRFREDMKSPWLLGIISIVVIALMVNIGMIIAAVKTNNGLVVKDYYERGKNYFRAEIKQRKTDAIGMRLQILVPDKILRGKPQVYRFYVIDPDGKPVTNGQSIMFAYRTSNADRDFQVKLPMSEAGMFSARISFDLPGTWDLIAQVKTNGGIFDVARRIYVIK